MVFAMEIQAGAIGTGLMLHETPSINRILDEQATEFPEGALGIFSTPAVRIAPSYQAEAQAVMDWKEGRIGLVGLIARLEALQREETVAASLAT